MCSVGMESDTRAYFTAVTMMISLPTGTKIFNWLCTYLNNAPLLHIRTSAALFTLIFLLMFTIGGSTGVILGNAVVDIALHDTYYVVAHFHFVLSGLLFSLPTFRLFDPWIVEIFLEDLLLVVKG
jgi:heme/copper-type cytochrome/quinol oxidase subunit 1